MTWSSQIIRYSFCQFAVLSVGFVFVLFFVFVFVFVFCFFMFAIFFVYAFSLITCRDKK